MPIGPAAVVNGVAITAPLQSLAVSAIPITEPNDRWTMGMQWCPESCTTGHGWAPICAPGEDPGDPEALPDPEPIVGARVYYPFMIMSAINCCAYGDDQREYEARARRQVEAATPKALEQEFWTGTLIPANLHLDIAGGDAATILNGGVATESKKALAGLVDALADCFSGGRGMIHTTPYVATLWAGAGLIDEDGPRLVTKVGGHIVVPGAGYPGSGAAGAAAPAGQSWAYATGMVQVRLGAIEVFPESIAEAREGNTNRLYYQGQRMAAATWDGCDGCLTAVLISDGAAPGAGGGHAPLVNRSGTIAAVNTSQQVAAANTARTYLFVQNVSTGDLWVEFGGAAVASQPSIKLLPNGYLEYTAPGYMPTGTVNILGGTIGQAYVAKEA